MMASVGLGMSAFTAAGQTDLVICGLAPVHPSAPIGGQQKPGPAPQCPFCFVTAQTAGHIALTDDASALPAYAGRLLAAISNPVGDRAFVPQFRRTAGDPRAPPSFSV